MEAETVADDQLGAFLRGNGIHEARLREWLGWYNTEHLHSSIRFVTPDGRHFGREQAILAGRRDLYENARLKNPNRWSANIRNWEPVETVYLNLEPETPI